VRLTLNHRQQRCDYDIVCELDEKELRLNGKETITYFNNSPDPLTYLWIQLDENQHSKIDNSGYQNSSNMQQRYGENSFAAEDKTDKFGDKIQKVTDAVGKDLKYTINKTMMRVELPSTLKPGQQFVFKIDWYYYIPDRMSQGGERWI
jgi:hypothetical protein